MANHVEIEDNGSNTTLDLVSSGGKNVIPIANPDGTVIGTPTGTQDVNLKQVGGTATAAGAGAVDAGTQRATLASDDPAVTSLSTIDGKTPALGQATKANSVPTTLASDQEAVPTKPDKTSSASVTTKVDVGSGSTPVLSANANRKKMILVNDSNETIYVNFSATAVLNEGIRLNANGGNVVDDIYTGAVSAISASGSKNLTVTEL